MSSDGGETAVLSTSGWWARSDGVVCSGLGQDGAISPQTCARAPSRTENSDGSQLSCEISLQIHIINVGPAQPSHLLFIHSAKSGLFRSGFPSGPILAGF